MLPLSGIAQQNIVVFLQVINVLIQEQSLSQKALIHVLTLEINMRFSIAQTQLLQAALYLQCVQAATRHLLNKIDVIISTQLSLRLGRIQPIKLHQLTLILRKTHKRLALMCNRSRINLQINRFNYRNLHIRIVKHSSLVLHGILLLINT